MLSISLIFSKVSDFRIASELIWGGTVLMLDEYIKANGIGIKLCSHASRKNFARALCPEFSVTFWVFEGCHSAFYTNVNRKNDVEEAYQAAVKFGKDLKEFQLASEHRAILQRTDFDD